MVIQTSLRLSQERELKRALDAGTNIKSVAGHANLKNFQEQLVALDVDGDYVSKEQET